MNNVKPSILAKYNSYIGKKYNSLTILNVSKGVNHYNFECKCDCGNITTVRANRVLNNITKTCGCRNKHYNYNTNNRLSVTYHKLYSIWNSIRHRCYNNQNHKYKNYGARGIAVCKEWLYDFKPFFDWAMAHNYQEGLTLDRIDVNGNYEPSNCRWTTHKVQSINKTNTKYVHYRGETKPLLIWCEQLNLPYKTISYRLKKGWEPAKSFETPILQKKYSKDKFVEFNGVSKKLSEWCKELNLNYQLTYLRLRRGWSIDKAFNLI